MLAGGHDHGQTPNHGHDHGHDHDHDHGHNSRRSHDNNLRSAYMHVIADALTSVLAILALLAGRYLGWVWLDPIMGIVGAVVIARWAWVLMRDTSEVLLDTTDRHVTQEICQALKTCRGVHITDLHVWQIGPQARAAIISVTAAADITVADIRARLAAIDEIRHLTIEVVPQ